MPPHECICTTCIWTCQTASKFKMVLTLQPLSTLQKKYIFIVLLTVPHLVSIKVLMRMYWLNLRQICFLVYQNRPFRLTQKVKCSPLRGCDLMIDFYIQCLKNSLNWNLLLHLSSTLTITLFITCLTPAEKIMQKVLNS